MPRTGHGLLEPQKSTNKKDALSFYLLIQNSRHGGGRGVVVALKQFCSSKNGMMMMKVALPKWLLPNQWMKEDEKQIAALRKGCHSIGGLFLLTVLHLTVNSINRNVLMDWKITIHFTMYTYFEIKS